MEWEEEQEITKRGGNLKQRKNGRNENMIEKVKRIRKKKTEKHVRRKESTTGIGESELEK